MKRGTIFRKPSDDYDDDRNCRIVHAKPIDPRFVRKLGGLGAGKDFVISSSKQSQEELSGNCSYDAPEISHTSSSFLSRNEKNKIEAKILKAEMKGNTELAERLRKKLNDAETEASEDNIHILMKTDRRTGLTVPASRTGPQRQESKFSDNKYRLGSVESVYQSDRSVREMVAEEKKTSADDQLTMFSRAAKCANRKTDDDWVVDDALLSHKRIRKQEERDERKESAKIVRENRDEDRLLDSCARCINSSRLAKHCIVAIGIKTYLTVTPWKPLVNGHCFIVPTAHYSSTVTLDEDVYDEMRIWRKGLTAMWKADDMDCVFIETAKNVKHRGHMVVECIPIPIELGETAPIFFKKAIDESEIEWSDNKKLIDLSKKGGDIRKAIPKGFSYFAVDFGLQAGYAHIIEDESRFPKYFAHEIIGGMLDLEPNSWRKNECLSSDVQMANAKHLKNQWIPFDWTEKVKKSLGE